METWQIAQKNEREWWGNCLNTYHEEEKQLKYAEKMGLEMVPNPKTPYAFDLGGKSVLDIGGGPISILLKCSNVRGMVIDPLEYPAWVQARYEEAGIEYKQGKGEDIDATNFDEVWIYNVLQHVDDPGMILNNARRAGKLIRIFEWVDTPPNPTHPNKLNAKELDRWLGGKGTVEETGGGRVPAKMYYGQFQGNMLESNPVKPGIRHKRFHLLSLPHVPANQKELCCAFSQKVVKMGKMLKSMGHTVFFYGVEGSQVECDEFIQVSTQAIIDESYGVYDTSKETYRHNVNSNATKVFNRACIKEIRRRMSSDDFLLIPFSPQAYKAIIDELMTKNIDRNDKLKLIVEMGIGYRGTYCPYKVFESISQMHLNYGLESAADGGSRLNGSHYDAVIPNYFDPVDFTYCEDKDDYILFLGRVIKRKGIYEAIQATNEAGIKLIVAGQDGGQGINLNLPGVEYVGFADYEKRRELLSKAKALILPTQYIEPFGGVIIEAAFSGTPVITSNHGAFPELVRQGETGFKCQTLDHYVKAIELVSKLDPKVCYDYAMKNFSLDRVKLMYEEYWDMLLDLKENVGGKGWSRIHPERTNLDWLVKY